MIITRIMALLRTSCLHCLRICQEESPRGPWNELDMLMTRVTRTLIRDAPQLLQLEKEVLQPDHLNLVLL